MISSAPATQRFTLNGWVVKPNRPNLSSASEPKTCPVMTRAIMLPAPSLGAVPVVDEANTAPQGPPVHAHQGGAPKPLVRGPPRLAALATTTRATVSMRADTAADQIRTS